MSQVEIKPPVTDVIYPDLPETKKTLDQFKVDVEIKMEISEQTK